MQSASSQMTTTTAIRSLRTIDQLRVGDLLPDVPNSSDSKRSASTIAHQLAGVFLVPGLFTADECTTIIKNSLSMTTPLKGIYDEQQRQGEHPVSPSLKRRHGFV
jgi:hypothetical protein